MSGDAEFLMWFNSNYKVKLWDTNEKLCKKTALGPVYAREVVRTKLITFADAEPDKDVQYLAYATESKVIGLIKLPLDGNPHKTMGLIAHSGKIADICVSYDNKYLFTCGGKVFRRKKIIDSGKDKKIIKEELIYESQDDYSVGMWQIDRFPIEQAVEIGRAHV